MSDSGITLRLINRYNKPIRITALGGLADGNDQNGATKVYEWDLSAESWNAVDTVSLQVKYPSASEYTLVETALTDLSVVGVVRALNTLDVGLFNYQGNVIYIPNSNIEYGDLSLRLGNVDLGTLKAQAYEFFVPVGSTLRNEKYPSFASWEAEYGAGFDLLLSQTTAATGIATYGMGCIMPYTGSSSSLPALASIGYAQTAPKPQQPIFSWSGGTSTGNSASFTTGDTNIWAYFPSGDATEVTIITLNDLYDADVFYHEYSKWSSLSTFRYNGHNNLITFDQMFPSNTIAGWRVYNTQALTVPAGWKYPAIQSSGNVTTLELDDTGGIAPNMSFVDANDFTLLTSTGQLQNFTIEGKSSIKFPNTTWDYDVNTGNGYYFFQYNGTISLTSTWNTMFANLTRGTGLKVFNFRFNANTVVFEDLTTPIQISGITQTNFGGADLTDFPPIDYINAWEIDNPTFVQLDFRAPNNNLSTATVNQILIDLDNATVGKTLFGGAGTIALQNQVPPAPPSGAGLTARTNLISRGFTVTTD